MFAKLYVCIFLLSSLSMYAQEVSINNTNANAIDSSNGYYELGQSFKATQTSLLKSISVVNGYNNDNGADFNVSVYAGEGYGGTLLYTQNEHSADIANNSLKAPYTLHTITLNTPVSLDANQIYTFRFTPAGAVDFLLADASYGDGSLIINGYVDTSSDLIFTIVAETPNRAPLISGSATKTTVGDNVRYVQPFTNLSVSDPDDDNISVTITFDPTVGFFSGGGLTQNGDGNYTIDAMSGVYETYALSQLMFYINPNTISANTNFSTIFTLIPSDGVLQGTANSDTNITVTSINDAPLFVSLSNMSVLEKSASNTLVGTLSTVDKDISDSHVYTFCSGLDNTSFTIVGNTLKTNGVFDYDTKHAYNTCIRSTDTAGSYIDANITINILKIDDSALTIGSVSAGEATQNAFYSYPLHAKDGNKSAIRWFEENTSALPDWLDIVNRVTTIAGIAGTSGNTGDGQTADNATFGVINGLAVATNGDVYISDWTHSVIRKRDATTGIITRVAGGGSSTVEGVAATSASISPLAIALDSQDNLYIAQYASISKVDKSTGIMTTIAGTLGSSGSTGENILATSAKLTNPNGITFDKNDNLYIADSGNNAIRKVDATTHLITTVAGTLGSAGNTGNGGLATSAKLNFPYAVAVDSAGNLFIADMYNHVIRRVDAQSGIIETIAGTIGKSGMSDRNDGISAKDTLLYAPINLIVDGKGDLYFAEIWRSTITKIDMKTTQMYSIAGIVGEKAQSGEDNSYVDPKTLKLLNPRVVALDSYGDIYFGDDNYVLRRISTYLEGTPSYLNIGTNDVNISCTNEDKFKRYVFQIEVASVDRDNDGVLDADDAWPNDARYGVDSDGDGLPDSWEIFEFGNLTTANASSDYDGDGYSDLEEFQSNSDVKATEATREEALRRVPPMLVALSMNEEMNASQSYTVDWTVMGYDEGYVTLMALFDCSGIAEGECGSNYEENFYSVQVSTPATTEDAPWGYRGEVAKYFTYETIVNIPATKTDGTAWDSNGTDIVVRFYQKTFKDAQAGKSSNSLLIPGNITKRYYDNVGRRIIKTLYPQDGCL